MRSTPQPPPNRAVDWRSLEVKEIAGGITAAGVILLFGKKIAQWAKRAWRRFRIIISVPEAFAEEFGDIPARKIQEIFKRLMFQSDIDKLEIQILHKHLQFGVYICAPEGGCIQANAYLCHLFGMDHRDMVSDNGYGWLRAVHEMDRLRVHSAWKYSVQNSVPYQQKYRVQNVKSGEMFWVDTEAMVARKDGVVTAMAGWLQRCDPPEHAEVPEKDVVVDRQTIELAASDPNDAHMELCYS